MKLYVYIYISLAAEAWMLLFMPRGSALSPGIGYASIVIVSLLNIYYIVILAWGVYYLFQVGSRSLSLVSTSDRPMNPDLFLCC